MILTLLFATGMTALAYSSFASTEANFAIARQETDALRAELAAASALSYGKRQLSMDSDWPGTGNSMIEYAPDHYFSVTAATVAGGAGALEMACSGESGDGFRELSAELTPQGGNFQAEVALAMLGADDHLQGSEIYGDVLVTDAMSCVYDWRRDANGDGAFYLEGPDSIEGSGLHCSTIYGNLYKFTDYDFCGWPTNEIEIDTPHSGPEWDLDVYCDPDKYTIMYNVKKLSYETHYKPVVIVNSTCVPQVYIKNCNLYGGLVVWCPNDYDLRDGSRNRLKYKNSVIGSHCQPYNIGIIAPACEIQQIGNASWSYGFSFVNNIKKMQCMHMEGMLYVVNRIKQMKWTEIEYSSYVNDNLPPGIELDTNSSGYSISSIGESL